VPKNALQRQVGVRGGGTDVPTNLGTYDGGGVEGSHHEASLGAGLGREDPSHPDHVRPHRATTLQGGHRRVPITDEHPGLKQHEPRIWGIKVSLRVRAIELLPTF
jgi:hypothetical protein